MREILFRGKRVDNTHGWVYGDYHDFSRGKSISFFKIFIGTLSAASAVVPETVGQYTGVKDENDTKIFEGDILSAQFDEEVRGHVCWNDCGWHIKIGSRFYPLERDWIRHYFRIIGNIHDNPKLLENKVYMNQERGISNASNAL